MSCIVVTIEDIFREFGYGSRDITALRDFVSYTFHHAKDRPFYLTLLGGGHCDYQNRQTNAPNWIPVWENEQMDFPGSFRTGITEPYPDDAYFARLNGASR